jgi:hypothetical protein
MDGKIVGERMEKVGVIETGVIIAGPPGPERVWVAVGRD